MSATPSALGRRERNKAEKRARILAAARTGLAEQGYEKMTMSWVAQTADVATGTVFQYANTKAELLMMVTADRWSAEFPAVLDAARHQADPVGAVLAMLSPLVTASAEEPETTMVVARELLFGAPGEHHDAVLALVDRLEREIADVVSRSSGLAAARLIVSGGLVELNRARRQDQVAGDAVLDRLEVPVRIALAGASSVTTAEEGTPA